MELVLQYTQLQTALPYRISDWDIIPTKVTLSMSTSFRAWGSGDATSWFP